MARSVKISTPIPSVEEVGKRLGLSKARQSSLLQIILGTRAIHTAKPARRATGKSKASGSSKSSISTTRSAES